MCGIIGALNNPDAWKIVNNGLNVIKNRGLDGVGYYDGTIVHSLTLENLKPSKSTIILGHRLHSIVNTIAQPLENDGGVLTANCEIYNWKQLCMDFNIEARNDSELLLKLLNLKGLEQTLPLLRGVYAFAYQKEGKVYLARDILGVKPLWYQIGNGFIFCSEKKALPDKKGIELNPRNIAVYDIKKEALSFIGRDFIKLENENKSVELVKDLLIKSIELRVPDQKFGLLFSGGLDSVIIAKILKDLGHNFVCYTAATSEDARDLVASKKAAEALSLELKYTIVDHIENLISRVAPLIEDSNIVKVGVALPLFAASSLAKDDGCRVIFSGSGADEIFAGYNRYRLGELKNLNKDCFSDLLKIYEKNTYRDDLVTMNNNLELRVPFLDLDVVNYSLNIKPELKLIDGVEKHILRKVALSLGISEEFAFRKKKAAQYGSGFDKEITRLAKRSGKNKSLYLKNFYKVPNVKLAALVSGGKDSIFAMHTMQKQNYEVSCMVTMQSKNKDSYMFQSDGTELVKLQSKSLGIPLIEQVTHGEKEKELEDLELAINRAKEEFGVEGVVSGALYSNYQRERIEIICDKLGLKIFSPLWHLDQEKYMRELLRCGFKFIFVKIAAEGLDESWLGKIITTQDIDKLAELHHKIGFNISGEGGEFESIVLDGPNFKNKIDLPFTSQLMESPFIGSLVFE